MSALHQRNFPDARRGAVSVPPAVMALMAFPDGINDS